MTTIVADIETDSLTPTKIWCICTIDHDTKEEGRWSDYDDSAGSLEEGLELLRQADRVVFHNGLDFDLFWLSEKWGVHIHPDKVLDTLIMSRMFFKERNTPKVGHSLESWGETFDFPKGKFSDFGAYSKQMLDYCMQDVRITDRLFGWIQDRIRGERDWDVIRLEMHFNFVVSLMTHAGVRFDKKLALEIYDSYASRREELEKWFEEQYPTKVEKRYSKTIFLKDPNNNKDFIIDELGHRVRNYDKGFLLDEFGNKVPKPLKDNVICFKPNSNDHIVAKLVGMGWRPKLLTPSGKPQVNEAILSTLKYPLAKRIAEYKKLDNLMSKLMNARGGGWIPATERDGRVRHTLNSVGATSSRCSHFNINVSQLQRGSESRKCVVADEGWKMVGIDASELELRVLGHYLRPYDDGDFIRKIVFGQKERKTDAHSMTASKLGISRDDAKTLQYAFNYGCGNAKLAQIMRDAGMKGVKSKDVRSIMNEAVVGIEDLTKAVQQAFRRRGYVLSLAGRSIPKPESLGRFLPHKALNYLIQGSGSEIMKLSLSLFHFRLAYGEGLVDKETLRPIGYKYLLNIHDEQQITCEPDLAQKIGELYVESIKEAGRQLGCHCAMDGEYKIGDNWYETH